MFIRKARLNINFFVQSNAGIKPTDSYCTLQLCVEWELQNKPLYKRSFCLRFTLDKKFRLAT